MFAHALTRLPGPDFADGLTTAGLGIPDHALMLRQHAEYVAALRRLGVAVEVLDPLPGYPDAHFVEDVAVVTYDLAVLTRPGADSRRGEVAAIEPFLGARRRLARIEEPGRLDGGDVMHVGRSYFVGLSERTNEEGAAQLCRILADEDFSCVMVPVGEGLHLKSGVNHAAWDTLLLTEDFIDLPQFRDYDKILVPAEESYAANTLLLNGTILTPAGFPRTRAELQKLDLPVVELDMSEARKMDGGLTCLSLRY